jgi:hypothetical protein
VPSLITPGDQVSFILPKFQGPTRAGPPKPAADPAKLADPAKAAADPAGVPSPEPKAEETDIMQEPVGQTETHGPFTVLSVGNRLGDAKVMQSAKIPQLQENVLGIRVSSRVPGEAQKATVLWDRLQAVNFRQIGIEKHGKQ